MQWTCRWVKRLNNKYQFDIHNIMNYLWIIKNFVVTRFSCNGIWHQSTKSYFTIKTCNPKLEHPISKGTFIEWNVYFPLIQKKDSFMKVINISCQKCVWIFLCIGYLFLKSMSMQTKYCVTEFDCKSWHNISKKWNISNLFRVLSNFIT